MSNAADFLPKHRADFESLDALFRLEPREVDKSLAQLITWLQDRNYPVAKPIADYVVGRANVAVPHVREVLRTGDAWWQYNVLLSVVDRWPRECVAQLEAELTKIAHHALDEAQGTDVRALYLLVRHDLGDANEIDRLVSHKVRGARAALEELLEIQTMAKAKHDVDP